MGEAYFVTCVSASGKENVSSSFSLLRGTNVLLQVPSGVAKRRGYIYFWPWFLTQQHTRTHTHVHY